MVPDGPSRIQLKQLSPNDFYALNNINGVKIDRGTNGDYALNDLILELSHLIDRDTLKKFELKVLEKKLKIQFDLNKDFSLVDQRNKEIDFVQKELEEIAWRLAARFNEKDKIVVKDMISIGRGVDRFDQAFFKTDMQSFEEFFNVANTFDSRTTLLENWICRKEEEYRKRVNLPTPELQKSDQELNKMFDAPRKVAREKLVSKMLTNDEFGVSTQKQYNALTTKELHMLVESLSVRLNLFNQKYPAFLPQVVRAIMEHQNLANSDRSTLDTYCTLFELDWRGDRNIDNREDFLLINPIYMHNKDPKLTSTAHLNNIDAEFVKKKIMQANIPFLEKLVNDINEVAKK